MNEIFSNETEFRNSVPKLYLILNRRISSKSKKRWWEFPNVRNLAFYRGSNEKLLSPRTSDHNSFALDTKKHVIKGTNTAIIANEHDIRHCQSILNSKLADYWYDQYGFGYHGSETKKYEPQKVKKYSLPILKTPDENLIKLANERNKLTINFQSLIRNNTFTTFLQDNRFQALEFKNLGNITNVYIDSKAMLLHLDYFRNIVVDNHKLKIELKGNFLNLTFSNSTVQQWVKLILESISEEDIKSLNTNQNLNSITKKFRKIRIPWVNEIAILESHIQKWIQKQSELDNIAALIEFLDRIIDRYVYSVYELSEEQINEIEEYYSNLNSSPLPSMDRVYEFLKTQT